MTLRGLARRYANALYDVLHKAGISKRVARLKPLGVIKG